MFMYKIRLLPKDINLKYYPWSKKAVIAETKKEAWKYWKKELRNSGISFPKSYYRFKKIPCSPGYLIGSCDYVHNGKLFPKSRANGDFINL